MAEVFISYAREDRDAAAKLAAVIRREGWTVWWDREIQVGRSFSETIEGELEAARCVVVLWSRASVKSQWVLAEASEGAGRGILVPVRIEDVRPPLEFRRLHTADALALPQGLDDPGVKDCIDALAALLGAGIPRNSGSERLADVEDRPSLPTTLPGGPFGNPPHRIGAYLILSIILILVIMWLGGFVFHIGGSLIYILLAIALVMLVVRLATAAARGRSNAA